MAMTDYNFVEFIKNVSPYGQYILTDIVPVSTWTTSLDIKFGVNGSETNQPIIGVRDTNVAYQTNISLQGGSPSIAFYNHFSWRSGMSANFIYNASQISNNSNNARQTLRLGLSSGAWGNQSASYASEYNSLYTESSIPLAILGNNLQGTVTPFQVKEVFIYGITIYDSGNNLIHNLRPVERISDGELGLWDSVTDKFYGNSGSGSFTKGDYSGVWYIEDGELHNTNFLDLPATAMSQPYPDVLWRITEGVNDGLPYNMLMADVPAFGAFANATSLAVIHIPRSVKSIGVETFRNTNLISVTIASDCTYYDTSFPEGCVVNFYPD